MLIKYFLKTFLCFLAISCYSEKTAYGIDAPPTILKVIDQEIVVNGRTSKVFNIVQSDGKSGLTKNQGENFNVLLENHTSMPTCVHWHGVILPNSQDGMPYVTQAPIPPGKSYYYNFEINHAGTYWMHSHYGLQEQKLLSAPLIFLNPKENHQKDVVLFLEDFSFKDPKAIFDELRSNASKKNPSEKMDESKMSKEPMKHDLYDVTYDAFLTNRKTLNEPDVVTVQPGEIVRLRVINGSSSTNFFINLGDLQGIAIAADADAIIPLVKTSFELATAQRIVIIVKIPGEGAFPILAQGEGTDMQTGLVLATPGVSIPKISEKAKEKAGAFSYEQELALKATIPLAPKQVNRSLKVDLEGNMEKYVWTINEQVWPNVTPLMIKEGERVEIVFNNKTMMSHPMHYHGHTFQVTEINGRPLKGAKRDTILVLPKSQVKVQFDADNPGIWMLHCHNLYHQHAGMMTTVNYEGYKGPVFTIEEKMKAE